MIFCDECDEPILGPHGKLVEPFKDDEGFALEQHFCPECFCILFHGDHEDDEPCKPWCNSLSADGKLDENKVKYCNCKLLDGHKENGA